MTECLRSEEWNTIQFPVSLQRCLLLCKSKDTLTLLLYETDQWLLWLNRIYFQTIAICSNPNQFLLQPVNAMNCRCLFSEPATQLYTAFSPNWEIRVQEGFTDPCEVPGTGSTNPAPCSGRPVWRRDACGAEINLEAHFSRAVETESFTE
jgi:hypothetical protein